MDDVIVALEDVDGKIILDVVIVVEDAIAVLPKEFCVVAPVETAVTNVGVAVVAGSLETLLSDNIEDDEDA